MRSLKCALISLLCVSLLLIVAGCGGSSSNPSSGGPKSSGGSGEIQPGGLFVLSLNGAGIMEFSDTASGQATPTAIVNAPTSFSLGGLAIDDAGNVYVGYYTPGNTSDITILGYAPGAGGSAQPVAQIPTSFSSTLSGPIASLQADHAGNIYMAVEGSIAAYSRNAGGEYTQSRVISGSSTGIIFPGQMATDAANNLYVTNVPITGPGSILIFSPTANGNEAPMGTIGGTNTRIDAPGGLALDSAGNIYVVTVPANGSQASSIMEFGAGSQGNVAPMRTIAGSATELSDCCSAMRVDSQGNIYVSANGLKIFKFASTATGNAAPIAEIDNNLNVPYDANWSYLALQ